jgi:hypothetical protein
MGLVLGVCLLRSPNKLAERMGEDAPPYTPVTTSHGYNSKPHVEPVGGLRGFFSHPKAYFAGRKGLWWTWWLVRAAALVAVFVGFIVLLNNFYIYRVQCSWCRHLSCLPVKNWCSQGNLVINNSTTNTTKRSVDMMFGMEGSADLSQFL